jgi:isopropylmalate/homocitrate/citramalate synthase
MPDSHISFSQKREFISLLHETGVPEIEIGLPDGMSACLELADMIHEIRVAVKPTALVPFYTNRWKMQIDQAENHEMDRIDILGPVSDYLLGDSSLYGMTSDEILPKLTEVLQYAATKKLAFSIGLIDATRAPMDRILALLEDVRDSGASRLVIYDSVGIMTPNAMKTFITQIASVTQIPILVHCHNDYGMATANTLAAIEAGAQAADVAVNGVGGRAGNAALEEVTLALKNLYGIDTGIDLTKLRKLSVLTEQLTGVSVSKTKPVVGEYCFAHLPVMHIRCIAGGNPSAFEAYPPEQVGTERKYHFSLPVNYSVALEPFVKKNGTVLTQDQEQRVLAILKAREGCSEEEVIETIRGVIQESA